MRECIAFDTSPALKVDMQVVEFSALLCQEFEKWNAVEDGIFRGLLVKVVKVEAQTLQVVLQLLAVGQYLEQLLEREPWVLLLLGHVR